jgi:hypothetical protein
MASSQTQNPKDIMERLGSGDAPVLETLAQMTIGSKERSGLSDQSYRVARMAALVASDAAPVSYLANFKAAEKPIPPEDIVGTLVAIAPVVGTAKVVSAASHMVRAGMIAGAMADKLKDGY